MTLDKLEQYISICNEVKLWRNALDSKWRKAGGVVRDTVRGSSAEYPYTSHPIAVTGVPANIRKLDAEEERYRRRVERCEALKQEIEDYIDSLEDSQLRQIMHCRFICGHSWVKTAQMIGGNNSVSSVRMRVSRHLQIKSA